MRTTDVWKHHWRLRCSHYEINGAVSVRFSGVKSDDFFGIEDLLDQAYEDAVYSALTPAYLG